MTCFDVKTIQKHNIELNNQFTNRAIVVLGVILFLSMTLVGMASADMTSDLANFSTMFTSFTSWIVSMLSLFMTWPLNLFVALAVFSMFWNKVAAALKMKSVRRK